MKHLYLVRHAKSSWDDHTLSDLERPLNKRGKRDAPFMGKLLKKLKVNPDLILSSPAKRALTTAKIFAGELDFPEKNIVVDDDIYESSPGEIINVISEVGEENKSIMVFGHNPSFSSLAYLLTNSHVDMPTCSIAAIEFTFNSWSEIEPNTGKLIFFEYPKKYFNDK